MPVSKYSDRKHATFCKCVLARISLMQVDFAFWSCNKNDPSLLLFSSWAFACY